MKKQVVHTAKVPPARVPLSQAIEVGDWLFASGQLGLEVATGKLVAGGIAAETRQVCENLKAVLEAGGSSLEKVVKVTIYMVDLGELMAMNEVFSRYFPVDPPARTTFQCVGLVGGARIEIEAIATT
ncbi:MAG: reactive intermediate/imine deaminase [Candidatus Rokuibacteriota bacterium]|nr:MAG: reactive intermediate/imine deaminase [Candidatus Rokubacteria bacterium]